MCPYTFCSIYRKIRSNSFCGAIDSGERSRAIMALMSFLSDEQIWIEWDNNGKTNVYRYGAKGYYDVLIVDEPRLPKPNGELAVGCIVTPG